MRRLIGAFVVRTWHKQISSWRGSADVAGDCTITPRPLPKMLLVHFSDVMIMLPSKLGHLKACYAWNLFQAVSVMTSLCSTQSQQPVMLPQIQVWIYKHWARAWHNHQNDLCAQRRHRLDEADLSLRWAQGSFCWICRAAARSFFCVKWALTMRNV